MNTYFKSNLRIRYKILNFRFQVNSEILKLRVMSTCSLSGKLNAGVNKNDHFVHKLGTCKWNRFLSLVV